MTTMTQPPIQRQERRPTLRALTAAAASGLVLALIYAQAVLDQEFKPTLTIVAALMLLLAGLAAARRGWAPALCALLSTVMLAASSAIMRYNLAHPDSVHGFAYMVVVVVLALVTIAAGLGASVQHYRKRNAYADAPAPAVLVTGFALLAVFGLGAIVVAAVPRPATVGVSPEVLAELPTLASPGMRFDQTELRVKAGETVALRLENTHGIAHSFDIDLLGVHVPMASGQDALAIFKPTEPGTYQFTCNVPGHTEAGMIGTLIVEP